VTTQTEGRSVETFAAVVRAAALRRYAQYSCVETVRIGIEVGRYFGLEIKPLPVRLLYATADWWAAEDKRTAPGWSAGVPGTGATYTRGHGDRWDGHLCGYAPRLGLLIDFSTDQYHKPNHGIVVDQPLALPVPREQLRGGVACDYSATVVCWYQETSDTQWRQFPAWREHAGEIRAAAAEAIRLLRQGAS
jgi:hypothetical protein